MNVQYPIMVAVTVRLEEDELRPAPQPRPRPQAAPGRLPPAVEAAVWRGAGLARQTAAVLPTGWSVLDAELPGGGWPTQAVCEILSPQPAILEWRLLGPALRRAVAAGGQVVLVGPPRHPYLPGLAHEGVGEHQLVWVQADAPAERLWATEQLIKANAAGAVIAWLPQVRQEQLRRLQVCAQSCEGPVFLCRPQAAQHEASAAPLRVHATFGLDWELQVRVLKRRGPSHEGIVRLPSVPGGLSAILTPRLRRPSRFFHPAPEAAANALGSPVVPLRPRRHATSH
jgi:protein ImuA